MFHCTKGLDRFHIVNYYKNWVKTSLTTVLFLTEIASIIFQHYTYRFFIRQIKTLIVLKFVEGSGGDLHDSPAMKFCSLLKSRIFHSLSRIFHILSRVFHSTFLSRCRRISGRSLGTLGSTTIWRLSGPGYGCLRC